MSKRWPGRTVVGLTGNIATGKSAVMRLAADRGALTLDADRIVHELMDGEPAIQEAIGERFGAPALKPDGRVNRAALGAIVFADPEAMRHLEAITHPAVRAELFRRIGESQAGVVFVEAIKLLEGSLARECDQVWVTRCPAIYQIERLIVCRGLDWESAVLRVSAQAPQEDKVARADVVIDTDGALADTQAQFDLAWQRLAAGSPAQPPPAAPHPRPALPAEPARRPVPTRLNAGSAAGLRDRLAAYGGAPAVPVAAPVAAPEPSRSTADGVLVRRARPSDVPSLLLLMQRATGGAVNLKRSELRAALSERSYFIGQQGATISAVVGWHVDNLVGRIDQIYVYPLEATASTVAAVLAEVENSAHEHLCEAILAFLPATTPDAVYRLLTRLGYNPADRESLPRAWQQAAEESQPAETRLLLKVFRDRVAQPAQPGARES